jgi:hypothetical protein
VVIFVKQRGFVFFLLSKTVFFFSRSVRVGNVVYMVTYTNTRTYVY